MRSIELNASPKFVTTQEPSTFQLPFPHLSNRDVLTYLPRRSMSQEQRLTDRARDPPDGLSCR